MHLFSIHINLSLTDYATKQTSGALAYPVRNVNLLTRFRDNAAIFRTA
jgi:hypothetical protein